ncbi:MAG: hypothetical protein Q9160_004558 [Pyrenula sp. 1 TL-2023]
MSLKAIRPRGYLTDRYGIADSSRIGHVRDTGYERRLKSLLGQEGGSHLRPSRDMGTLTRRSRGKSTLRKYTVHGEGMELTRGIYETGYTSHSSTKKATSTPSKSLRATTCSTSRRLMTWRWKVSPSHPALPSSNSPSPKGPPFPQLPTHPLTSPSSLPGACGGSCACSTCHVILSDSDTYDKLPEPEDDENDMLDLAFGLTETSRLGCQVKMTEEIDGLEVRLPSMTRNLQASDFQGKKEGEGREEGKG